MGVAGAVVQVPKNFSILTEIYSVFLPWDPHEQYEQYERENDGTLKEELPRLAGAQYAIGDQWRNNFRKNEGMEPKQKQYPAVDVTGDRSKVWCWKSNIA